MIQHSITSELNTPHAILTNACCWSPCGEWIVYDSRSDAHGECFNSTTIEAIHIRTGEIRVLFVARNGSFVGAATWFPDQHRVIFMASSEHPTSDWSYAASRRHGLMIDLERPNQPIAFDARNIVPPFTTGALRGGSHVFTKHPTRDWVSFTYEDEFCIQNSNGQTEANRRTTALGVLNQPLSVPKSHPRNRDGSAFCVVSTPTSNPLNARRGDVIRACEEAWMGTSPALAVQGLTVCENGKLINEVYRVDLPENPIQREQKQLSGDELHFPAPPAGTSITRLTHTEADPFPGLSGPRHWLRSSHDGHWIAFIKCDAHGIPQLHIIPACGGEYIQIIHGEKPIASAFTWHPSRPWVTYIQDDSVMIVDVETKRTHTVAMKENSTRLLPLACVFSPSGKHIAYLKRSSSQADTSVNRIGLVEVNL